jgi:hypothetical protein
LKTGAKKGGEKHSEALFRFLAEKRALEQAAAKAAEAAAATKWAGGGR